MSNSLAASDPIRVGILTVSDSVARGEKRDVSGLTLRELVEAAGMGVARADIVADDRDAIAAWLSEAATQADVLITCGGTGLGPRDVTPEATLDVIERQVPGIAEALRAAGLPFTPHAMLSRAVSGVMGQTLVVNLPGSPAAVLQQFEVLQTVLPHAVELLHGRTDHHPDRGSAQPNAD